MIFFKKFSFWALLPIFFAIPHAFLAMENSLVKNITEECPPEEKQEIKKLFSLKKSCFNALLKEENTQKKIPALLASVSMPLELTHEFSLEVARKASFNAFAPIAQQLPPALYHEIGLELLHSREQIEERKNALAFLLDRSIKKEASQEVTEALQGMVRITDNICDIKDTKPQHVKKNICTHAMCGADQHPLLVNFLLAKGYKPYKRSLEFFFGIFELKAHAAKRQAVHDAQNSPAVIEFLQKDFSETSNDEKVCQAFFSAYNFFLRGMQTLLAGGVRPLNMSSGVLADANGIEPHNQETLFETITKRLRLSHEDAYINGEFASMALEEFLGLPLNEKTLPALHKLFDFNPNSENNSIFFLMTGAKDHPFAQKIPLFEKLMQEKIEFYNKLLCLLIPYCKDEVEKNKEQLEVEFKMPLEELIQWCEEQKK